MPQISPMYMMEKVIMGSLILVLLIYFCYNSLIPNLLKIQVVRKYINSL